MARTGVTYFDVSRAAESISDRGETPTVDKVREQLGTGSKSTIAPLLKRWRTDSGIITEPQSGLPNDILEVVKSLFDRVNVSADNRIEQVEQEFKSKQSGLESIITEANNKIQFLSDEKAQLQQELSVLKLDNTSHLQKIETLSLKLTKSETKLDIFKNHQNDLKSSIQELKKENRDVRDHFQHYQQQIAQDRHNDREQFQILSQQLQSEIMELRKQKTKDEGSISNLLSANEQLKDNNDLLNLETTKLHAKLSEQEALIKKLQTEMKIATDSEIKNKDIQAKLQEQLDNVSHERVELDKKLSILTLSFDKSQKELKQAVDKVDYITHENTILIQEKAIVQGEFKQLQKSLSEAI